MRIVGKMKFRNNTFLTTLADKKYYIIQDAKARHITNPDWLEALGVKREDAICISTTELNLHEKGEPLN